MSWMWFNVHTFIYDSWYSTMTVIMEFWYWWWCKCAFCCRVGDRSIDTCTMESDIPAPLRFRAGIICYGSPSINTTISVADGRYCSSFSPFIFGVLRCIAMFTNNTPFSYVGGDWGSEVLYTIAGDNNSDFRSGGVDDRVDCGEDDWNYDLSSVLEYKSVSFSEMCSKIRVMYSTRAHNWDNLYSHDYCWVGLYAWVEMWMNSCVSSCLKFLERLSYLPDSW